MRRPSLGQARVASEAGADLAPDAGSGPGARDDGGDAALPIPGLMITVAKQEIGKGRPLCSPRPVRRCRVIAPRAGREAGVVDLQRCRSRPATTWCAISVGSRGIEVGMRCRCTRNRGGGVPRRNVGAAAFQLPKQRYGGLVFVFRVRAHRLRAGDGEQRAGHRRRQRPRKP